MRQRQEKYKFKHSLSCLENSRPSLHSNPSIGSRENEVRLVYIVSSRPDSAVYVKLCLRD